MEIPYNSFNKYLKNKFPRQQIRKIPITAGFSCPNKDGTKSTTGCIFCDEYGSGPVKTFHLSIRQQIDFFIKKNPKNKFIAFFQAHSNTYAPLSELKEKYKIIFDYPDIIGLFIGTRPDSINRETYKYLEHLNKRIYLTVELGLQSIHPRSIRFLNRNHSYGEFKKTFSNLRDRNIDVVVHLIIGIPGEDKTAIAETVREMNRIKPAGIKLHLLHILKNTPLYDMYKKQKFKLLEKEEYEDLTIEILQNLAPDIVIHRITGERDPVIFYAPAWALNKNSVINTIRQKMIDQNTYQGKYFKK